jgi:two-component system LytT family response regulator
MLRTLIADDEPLARRKLRDLLGEFSWVQCVGEVADGPATVRAVDALEPDLLFLDIEMPGMSGLGVLERIAHQPAVIFTTAFDKYAVAAFELAALDYLLKPFGPERLHTALDRARQSLAQRGTLPALQRARTVFDGAPATRFFVRDRGKIVPLQAREILHLEARDDYVAVYVAGRRYLVHLPLTEFERRLDPSRFVRIHRSHIVNLDHVVAFTPYDGTRLHVELRDGTRLLASRTRSRELRGTAI